MIVTLSESEGSTKDGLEKYDRQSLRVAIGDAAIQRAAVRVVRLLRFARNDVPRSQTDQFAILNLQRQRLAVSPLDARQTQAEAKERTRWYVTEMRTRTTPQMTAYSQAP